MKTEKQIIGDLGEHQSRQYLERQGYTILETKWRYRRSEVDIICKSPTGVLVFVEVKTRATSTGNSPAAAVDAKKEKLMAKAAIAYMAKIGHEWEVRFDVIGVELKSEGSFDLRHFKDAFFPGKW